MSTATTNKILSEFHDGLSASCEAADTRSLDWFQLGDIGAKRMSILNNLPAATVEPVDVEDVLDDRTRGIQLQEQRASRAPDQMRILRGASGVIRLAASLRATVVCTLVGAWTAVEGEKTRPIALLRSSLMHELGHASMECERASYPIADFLEPVEYNWNEIDFEADRALKIFSEHTHADS